MFTRQSLARYMQNDCELQKPDPSLLMAIFALSYGDPCSDCNCKNTCPAWAKLQGNEKQLKKALFMTKDVPVTGETNAQVADRLGVSKRQVAKMRRDGKLS
jgi:hypothetical protein